jgi:hypothetical protein
LHQHERDHVRVLGDLRIEQELGQEAADIDGKRAQHERLRRKPAGGREDRGQRAHPTA